MTDEIFLNQNSSIKFFIFNFENDSSIFDKSYNIQQQYKNVKSCDIFKNPLSSESTIIERNNNSKYDPLHIQFLLSKAIFYNIL